MYRILIWGTGKRAENYLLKNYFFIYVPLCGYMHVRAGAHKNQKGASDLELE